MAAETKGIVRDCPSPQCARDGYFNDSEAPLEIVCAPEQIESDSLPDVVATYELFGKSAVREVFTDSHFVRPLVATSVGGPSTRREEASPVRAGDGEASMRGLGLAGRSPIALLPLAWIHRFG